MKKIIFFSIVILIVTGFYVSKFWEKEILRVQLEKVKKGDITQIVYASGGITAKTEVEISAQVVSGIKKIYVEEGGFVEKDQILLELIDDDFRAQIKSAEAKTSRLKHLIDLSNNDVEHAYREYNRSKSLLDKRAINLSEMQDLETRWKNEKLELEMAKDDLVDAESFLESTKEKLKHTVIRSPITGIVTKLMAEEGETVVVGTMNHPGTVLMTISNLDELIIQAQVDENDIPYVKPHQLTKVHLQYDKDLDIAGEVIRITPKGITGNDVAIFETFIKVNNPPEAMRIGMTCNVEIQIKESKDVLLIPSRAVLYRPSKDDYEQIVFLYVDGVVESRNIETGISGESIVEVIKGLNEKDVVITGPYRIFDKLRDGVKVH